MDLGDVQLGFDMEVLWNLDAISPEFACWIVQQNCVPATSSRVGILSSRKFERPLECLASEGLGRAFRLFIECSSVLYHFQDQPGASWKGYCTTDLGNMHSFAGTLVLQYLEKALGNFALATASLEGLKALFLIIVGTILVVSYSNPRAHTHTVSGELTLFIAMLIAC